MNKIIHLYLDCLFSYWLLHVVLQIVAVYNGAQKQMKILPGMTIQWPGGNIPLDVPYCGFKNENPACRARR